MKTILYPYLFFFAVSTLGVPLYGSAQDHETASSELVVLAPGLSAHLQCSSRGTISVSYGAVIAVRDLGSEIKVTAKKRGQSEIQCANQNYQVLVLYRKNYEKWQKLSQDLKGRRGLQPAVMDEDILVEGQLLSLTDWRELKDRGFLKGVIFQAQIPKELRRDFLKEVESELAPIGLTKYNLLWEPSLTIQLPPTTKENQEERQRVLAELGLKAQESKQLLDLQPMIQIEMLFVEADHQWMKSLGIQWPTQVDYQVLPHLGSSGESLVSLIGSKNKGFANLLARPKLTIRSGEKGQFHSGGEFPIRQSHFGVQRVEWKKHGLQMEITPTLDATNALRIDVKFEMSLIDMSRQVEGVPALNTQSTSTSVDLTRPHPVLLSGLLRSDFGRNQQSVPGLGSIPVLGRLFQSENYLSSRTEFIVVLIPKVTPSTGK